MNLIMTNGYPTYISRNVVIKDVESLPNHTVSKLVEAGDTISNYANAHKAKVTFYDARHDMPEFDVPSLDAKLTDSIGIMVEHNDRRVAQVDYVNRYANEANNKPFLRTVYESVQRMVEGKESPIVKHKSETMLKLVKAGKIKA